MKRLSVSFCILIFLFSCTGVADLSNESNIPEDNFYALTIGNSWVYKHYQRNIFTENYEETEVIDVVTIVDTESISGELYYKFSIVTTGNPSSNSAFFNSNGEKIEYLRELNGNLVNELGEIIFTNNNFEERLILEDGSFNVYETLINQNIIINVEAGEFECVYSERYARDLQGDLLDGLDRYYYSDGVGLIYNTLSFLSNSTPEIVRRLDSFVIQ